MIRISDILIIIIFITRVQLPNRHRCLGRKGLTVYDLLYAGKHIDEHELKISHDIKMTETLSSSEFERIQKEIRKIQETILNKDSSDDEHMINQIWTSIREGVYVPEQILKMLLTIDPDTAEDIWLHQLPKDLRSELDSLSNKWSGPMRSERERVQKERERVQKERERVQKERERVRKEIERVQKERERVQKEIRRADIERDHYRQQRKIVEVLNKTMEGQIAMYQELNTQLK